MTAPTVAFLLAVRLTFHFPFTLQVYTSSIILSETGTLTVCRRNRGDPYSLHRVS